ncbi:hypothetical protein BU16DRAFT_619244 [Lophium mytilinum]|uniref:Uncharacterized protein n=1 Tax=Lophium mytilinum TaxID=390894 RepID=A0A6A6QPX0_9PEZI|nr:hypothetical protein BU16DRAFT_619244 [Lophium mytilinum]
MNVGTSHETLHHKHDRRAATVEWGCAGAALGPLLRKIWRRLKPSARCEVHHGQCPARDSPAIAGPALVDPHVRAGMPAWRGHFQLAFAASSEATRDEVGGKDAVPSSSGVAVRKRPQCLAWDGRKRRDWPRVQLIVSCRQATRLRHQTQSTSSPVGDLFAIFFAAAICSSETAEVAPARSGLATCCPASFFNNLTPLAIQLISSTPLGAGRLLPADAWVILAFQQAEGPEPQILSESQHSSQMTGWTMDRQSHRRSRSNWRLAGGLGLGPRW